MDTTTTDVTAYVIIVHHPDPDDRGHEDLRLGPLVMPLVKEGKANGGLMFIFGSREKAEAFMESPRFDIPGLIHEVTMPQLAELLELVLAFDVAQWTLTDPPPLEEWPEFEEWTNPRVGPPGELGSVELTLDVAKHILSEQGS